MVRVSELWSTARAVGSIAAQGVRSGQLFPPQCELVPPDPDVLCEYDVPIPIARRDHTAGQRHSLTPRAGRRWPADGRHVRPPLRQSQAARAGADAVCRRAAAVSADSTGRSAALLDTTQLGIARAQLLGGGWLRRGQPKPSRLWRQRRTRHRPAAASRLGGTDRSVPRRALLRRERRRGLWRVLVGDRGAAGHNRHGRRFHRAQRRQADRHAAAPPAIRRLLGQEGRQARPDHDSAAGLRVVF